MSTFGIHGQLLEITVLKCNNLKDTETFSRQEPYVCLEYGGIKFRTRTCTDGGRNPIFQEKFSFTLTEGLREIRISVYNSNTLRSDDFIGMGSVQLQRVISQGYDNSAWSIFTSSGRTAGEVSLTLLCPGLMGTNSAPPPPGGYYPNPTQPSFQYPAPMTYPTPPANYPPPPPYQPAVYYGPPSSYGGYPSQGYTPPPPPPLPPPYYDPSGKSSGTIDVRMGRGTKRPWAWDLVVGNTEEDSLARNIALRGKLVTGTEEGGSTPNTELSDTAMTELDLDSPSHQTDGDTEMVCGSELASVPRCSALLWDTICF